MAGKGAGEGWIILVSHANNIYIFSRNAKVENIRKKYVDENMLCKVFTVFDSLSSYNLI